MSKDKPQSAREEAPRRKADDGAAGLRACANGRDEGGGQGLITFSFEYQ